MSRGFTAVRVGGGLLPPDVLSAVLAGDLDGLKSSDYHLGGEHPREAAARVWTHLTGAYKRFRDDLDRLPEGDRATSLTRERWLTILLSDLDYGRVPTTGAGGLTVADREYPVSHLWGATPIHLLGWNVELDTRTAGVPGAAKRAPHAMVQELLNRTDTYLWAIVSNGRTLRLLRDSTTLTGQAFVEFDLEAIFDGDLFSDFALLYLLAHQSRVEVPTDGVPADCWLERWRTTAVSRGVRALTQLRDGVQAALETLGTGYLQHPANQHLRDGLATGQLSLEDYHAGLLRTVYRILFWSVAEERDALLDPDAPQQNTDRYRAHFSSRRLRDLAARRHGSHHDDLWHAVTLVMNALGCIDGEPRLGLPGLGGLFNPTAVDAPLYGTPRDDEAAANDGQTDDRWPTARLGNQPLLAAIRHLSIVQPKGEQRRPVDFRHLGAEELGSVYESLLELVPRHDPTRHVFSLETLAGNDRKTTGSYYTPTALVELVLDTALDPVLDNAEKSDDPEAALLAVTACDPSIGSGHFMVAAARRIAGRLAAVRTGEVDPTPTATQEAMHDVVARCIYGVDINPMAADLAKVSLWLEAMTPGRPLSFLDHHIKVGNALLGTTPALLAAGIPDAAYTALTGDDKKTATGWKNLNRAHRDGQSDLFADIAFPLSNTAQRDATTEVANRAATARSLRDVAWAAQRYRAFTTDPATITARRLADGWCSAFLSLKTPETPHITGSTLDEIATGSSPSETVDHIDALAIRHRLFHWHLEFPEVFRVPTDQLESTPTGWRGGFTAMLGNPPWETLQLSEKEFFEARAEQVARAKNASSRKRAIRALAETHPTLYAEYERALRDGAAETSLIRGGRFPLCATGKINTYSVFAEHFRNSVSPTGRTGIITPTGLGTDATTAAFFADTLNSKTLAAFYDFENRAPAFAGVHRSFRFAVSSITGGQRVPDARLAFLLAHPSEVPSSAFTLSADELVLLNPNTGTLPVFRTRRDAEVTLACYRRHPILVRESEGTAGNPWGLSFSQGLFNMASDSELFFTAEQLEESGATFKGWEWEKDGSRWLPMYEAKMINHWNHRFATYEGVSSDSTSTQLPRLSDRALTDPTIEPLGRYWVRENDVVRSIPASWDEAWFLGWRKISNATNERTFVVSALPKCAAGDSFNFAYPGDRNAAPLLQAVFSSLVFDYLVRQKLSGSNVLYFLAKQVSAPAPAAFAQEVDWSGSTLENFIRCRVAELVFTSTKLAPYATIAYPSERLSPFLWIPARRTQIQAEIDAALLHTYGLDRADTVHVLESFEALERHETRDHGEYRTKRLVLREYDAMAEAARTGVPYTSPLDPPPGYGPRHQETSA